MSMPFGRRVIGSLPSLPINRGFRARLKHHDRDRFERLRRAAWRLMLDPMEPRVLLSADPFALAAGGTYDSDVMAAGVVSGTTLTVTIDDDMDAGTEIGVRIATGATAQEVIITDRHNSDIVIYQGNLTGITTLSIVGDDGDDHYAVEFDASTLGSTFAVEFAAGTGHDSVDFVRFDAGYTGSIVANAEAVRVASGVSLGTSSSKLTSFTATAAVTTDVRTGSGQDVADNGSALVQIDGTIISAGAVTVTATGSSTYSGSAGGVTSTITGGANAAINVTAGATVQGSVLSLGATVNGTITPAMSNKLAFVSAITTASAATVDVAGTLTSTGAISVTAREALDVKADITTLSYTATNAVFNDPDEASSIGVDFVTSSITAVRTSTVTIADGAAISGGAITLDATVEGDIATVIKSELFGLTTQAVTGNAKVIVGAATITGTGAVALSANNKSKIDAEGIIASNTVTGETSVKLTGATVQGTGVSVAAKDVTAILVQAKDLDIGLSGWNSISLPLGAAINEVNRTVAATVTGGSLTASSGGVSIGATNEMTLVATANAQQLNIPNGYVNPTGFALNIAGTLAVNELLGGTTASVTDATISAALDVDVIAVTSALIDSKTEASAQTLGGDGAAVALAVAYNNLGRDVDYTNFKQGIDTILGLGLVQDYQGFDTVALVTGSAVSGRDVNVNATTTQMLLDSTATNVAKNESIAVSRKTKSYAAGIVLATNMVTSATRATISNNATTRSTITATRNVSVTATDDASINSNVKLVANATAATDGGASNIDNLIGAVSPANYRTNGTIQTNGDLLTPTTLGTNPSLVFGDRVQLFAALDGSTGTATGTANDIYKFMGADGTEVDLTTTDFTDTSLWKLATETDLIPTGNSFQETDAIGLGGVVVRNEVASGAEALVQQSDIGAAGNITVKADGTGNMTAVADVGVTVSSGSSLTGNGDSNAVGGALVFNILNGGAKATLRDSTLTMTNGGAIVSAENATGMVATLHGAFAGGADTKALMMSFNTVGYETQNLLFMALDALLASDIGAQQPAGATALVTGSTVTATATPTGVNALSVSATNSATLTATTDMNATTAASAFRGADGATAAGVITQNMLSGAARASIVDSSVTGAGISILADDSTVMDATTALETNASADNDLGFGIINGLLDKAANEYAYTTKSNGQEIAFGQRVLDGESLYEYLGGDPLTVADWTAIDFTDLNLWQLKDTGNLLSPSLAKAVMKGFAIKDGGGASTAKSFMITRNEAHGGAEAFVTRSTLVSGGDVSVVARERASLRAQNTSTVAAKAAKSGVVATNALFSKATAGMSNGVVTTTGTGDVTVQALNITTMDAFLDVKTTGKAESIGYTFAFNTVGYDTGNILFAAVDAFLGSNYFIETDPTGAEAFMDYVTASVAGDLDVSAASRNVISDPTNVLSTAVSGDDLDNAAVAKPEDAADETADAAIKAALEAAFTTLEIEFEGDLTVEILAAGSQWYVTDSTGRIWQIKDSATTGLEVAEVSLLNATVGADASAKATNDRVLVDAFAESTKTNADGEQVNKGKSYKDLKYGANASATGGVLATNRVASETKAWISGAAKTHDLDSSVELLSTDDRVVYNGKSYAYIGSPNLIDADDGLGLESVPAALTTGTTVRLLGLLDAFDIGVYVTFTGTTITNTEGKSLKELIDESPDDWELAATPDPVVLTNAVQDFANNALWVDLGTAAQRNISAASLSVTAQDSANLRAETSLLVDATAINNMDLVGEYVAKAASNEYSFTNHSGTQLVLEGDMMRVGTIDVSGLSGAALTEAQAMNALTGRVFRYSGPDATMDLGAVTAATLTDASEGAFWIDLSILPDAQDVLTPNLGNLANSDAKATGATVVTNQVDGATAVDVREVAITVATGDIVIAAVGNATLLSKITTSVTTSGGSTWGSGTVVSKQGMVATNMLLGAASTTVHNADLRATVGDVTITADQAVVMDSTIDSNAMTGDTAKSLTLAFNTLGWDSQNILFNTFEAIIGDPFISDDLLGGKVDSGGSVTITATNILAGGAIDAAAYTTALMNATVTNSTMSEAGAIQGAGGSSTGALITSNKAQAKAHILIDNADAATGEKLKAGTDLSVLAEDRSQFFSNTKFVSSSTTSNTGGADVLQETLNDVVPVDFDTGVALGSVALGFQDRVRVDDAHATTGAQGKIYYYLGNDVDSDGNPLLVDLSTANFLDLDLWREASESSIIPQGYNVPDVRVKDGETQSGSDSKATGVVFVLNDHRSGASAIVKNAVLETTDGDISVTADLNASMQVDVNNATSSSGGNAVGEGVSKAISGTVGTNVMLGSAEAAIINSTVTAGDAAGGATNTGDVIVKAINDMVMSANMQVVTATGDTAYGVLAAFNTMGWKPSNILFNAVETLIGSSPISEAFNGEEPAEARAWMDRVQVTADGDIDVTADNTATVTATTGNQTTSAASALKDATGKGFGAIVASNKLSAGARAWITGALVEPTGTETLATDDFVIAGDGNVWKWTGAAGDVGIPADTSFGITTGWVAATRADVNRLVAGGDITISATDDATLNATNDSKTQVTVRNDGGLSIVLGIATNLADDYNYTTLSGTRAMTAGDLVRIGSNVATSGGLTDGDMYAAVQQVDADGNIIYGPNYANLIDLATTDYTDETLWRKVNVTPEQYAALIAATAGVAGVGNVSTSDATAVGAAISYNDVRSHALTTVQGADIWAKAGSITISAEETSTFTALNTGKVAATGGSVYAGGKTSAVNAIIATNAQNAEAETLAKHVTLRAGGAVNVTAENAATMSATVDMSTIATGGERAIAVGVTVAFNQIGYANSLIFTNFADMIAGTSIFGEDRAQATATLSNAAITSGGNLNVTADNALTLDATISSSAVSVSISKEATTSVSVAPILSMNRVAGQALAVLQDVSSLTVGGNVNVTALDTSVINAVVISATVAISASTSGAKSFAIGGSFTRNSIDSEAQARAIRIGSSGTAAGITNDLNVTARRAAQINATGLAASVAVSVSASSKASLSVSGAGALAANVIRGSADALVDASNLTVGGNTVISGTSGSAINATMAAVAASVSIGGGTSPAVAIGAAMAVNWIGYGRVAQRFEDQITATSIDGTITLGANDLVTEVRGEQNGNQLASVGYSYVGTPGSVDLMATDFTNTALWREEFYLSDGGVARIDAGDLVRVADGDQLSGAIFEYIGSESQVATTTDGVTTLVDLSLADFTNRDLWRRKDMAAGTDVGALAELRGSDLAGTGTVDITADAAQSITSTVVAAAVALSAGKTGVAVGIAGSVAVNNIRGGAYAAISGDMDSGVSGSTITVDAKDTSIINAATAAAAVSAALGKTAVSISVGLAVAYNEVSGDTTAEIVSADVSSTGTGATDGVFVNAGSAPPPSFTGAANPLVSVDRLDDATEVQTNDDGDAVDAADAAADKATIDKVTELMNDQLSAADAVQGSYTEGTVRLTKNNDIGGWTLVDKAGKAFSLKLGPAGELNFEVMTINAISAAAALAIAGGSTGIAVAGAGALSLNYVTSNVKSRISGSVVVSAGDIGITADMKSGINSAVLAAAISAGFGSTGVGVSIGAALAFNYVGKGFAGLSDGGSVEAYAEDSRLQAADALIITADNAAQINSVAFAGAVAIAAGSTGVAVSGSGVVVQNWVDIDTAAYISGDGAASGSLPGIQAGSITVAADGTGEINAFAAAVSVAFAAGSTGVAVSIGITAVHNEITGDTTAHISNADQGVRVTTGDMIVSATDAATINAVGAAAALAAGFGSVGVAVSGAGALITNRISSGAQARILNSDATVSAGKLTVKADSAGTIRSLNAAASLAVAAGATGVGVSIGVALARNLIGTNLVPFTGSGEKTTADTVQTLATGTLVRVLGGVREGDVYEYIGETINRASDDQLALDTVDFADAENWVLRNVSSTPVLVTAEIINSDLTTSGATEVFATSQQKIDAVSLAASAAASAGSVGVSVAGAGVATENRVQTDVTARITGTGNETLDVGSVSVLAADQSLVNVFTGAAAISAAFGGVGVGVSVALAASINVVENDVYAGITSVDQINAGGDVAVRAVTGDTQPASVLAGMTTAQLNDAVSYDQEDDGNGNDQPVASDVAGDAAILETLRAKLAAVGEIAEGELRLGLVKQPADANQRDSSGNLIATSDDGSTVWQLQDAEGNAWSLTMTSGGSLSALRTTINSAAVAAAVAITAGGVAVSVSGAGSLAINTVLSSTKSEIKLADVTTTNSGDVIVEANNSARINAAVLSAAISVAVGGVGVGVSVGASFARNFIGATSLFSDEADDGSVVAQIVDSNIIASGDISVTASGNQRISTVVFAGSAAAAGGAVGVGVAVGGAAAQNVIRMTETAQIVSNQNTSVSGASVSVNALDASRIDAAVAAVALTIAAGGVGVGVSIAGAVALNDIDNTITAQINEVAGNLTVGATGGDVSVVAQDNSLINSATAAAAVSLAAGGVGVAVAGAGAGATNRIGNTIRAKVAGATVTASGNIIVRAQGNATINAAILTAAASVAGGGVGVGVAVGGSVAINIIGLSNSTDGSFAEVTGATMNAGGNVTVQALQTATINTIVQAVSAAFAGGGVGVGVSGAVTASNSTLAYAVDASITNSAITSGGTVTVDAADTGTMLSIVGATSVAAAVGVVAVAVTVAVSVASGVIDNRVTASVSGTDVTASAMSVTASDDMDNRVIAAASAAAAAAGIGAAVAGGGAQSTLTYTTDVTAEITGTASDILSLSNSLNVDATSRTTMLSETLAASAAAGMVGVAASGVNSTLIARPDVRATVSGVRVQDRESGTATVDVTIDAISRMSTTARIASVSVGNTAALGGASGIMILDANVQAQAGGTFNVRDLSVTARTDGLTDGGRTADLTTIAGGGALLLSAQGADARITVTNDVTAEILSNSVITARDVSVVADGDSDAIARGYAATVGFVGLGGAGAYADTTAVIGATIGAGVALSGRNLTIAADGTNAAQGAVAVGAAGGIAAAVNIVDVDIDADVTAGIADASGFATQTDIDLTGEFSLSAAHHAQPDSEINTIAGGAIGLTGAVSNIDIDSTVLARVGSYADVDSATASFAATSQVTKNAVSGNNMTAKTGGLASAAGALSKGVLDLDTRVVFGANSDVETTGDLNAIVTNLITYKEVLNFFTAGAVSGAAGNNTVDASNITGEVRLDGGANVRAGGDLSMEVDGLYDISVKTSAETWGLATAASGSAIITLTPSNLITMQTGATMLAVGDLTLTTGVGADFITTQHNLSVTMETFAGSLVPLDDIAAKATYIAYNTINVKVGAVMESYGSMLLNSDQNAVFDTESLAKATSWVSAATDAVDSLLGGSMADQDDGELLVRAYGKVVNDGTMRTGAYRNKMLIIDNEIVGTGANAELRYYSSGQSLSFGDLDGDGRKDTAADRAHANYGALIDSDVGDIAFTAGSSVQISSAQREIEQLQAALAEYSNNADLRESYEEAIRVIEQRMLDSGFAVEETLDGVTSIVPIQPEIQLITIAPVKAEAGRIRVFANQLSGSGLFDTPKDASIVIINNTEASMNIEGIEIPETNGGLLLNGIDVTSDLTASTAGTLTAEVNANISSGLRPVGDVTMDGDAISFSFSGTTIGASSGPTVTLPSNVSTSAQENFAAAEGPRILIDVTTSVTQIKEERAALYGSFYGEATMPPQSITIEGDILNRRGSIGIFNKVAGGSITQLETANVIGSAVTLEAQGSISINASYAAYIGGDPYGEIIDLTASDEGITAANSGSVAAALTDGVSGTVQAERITITGEYVNIAGLVQAGKADFKVTLGASERQQILNATGAVTRITTSNDDFEFLYIRATHQLKVSPLTPAGGRIEISGNVTSTGSGKLVAYSGYPQVEIINNMGLGDYIDIVVNEIDGATRGTGEILIYDKTRNQAGDGDFIRTGSLYKKNEDGSLVLTTTNTNPPSSDGVAGTSTSTPTNLGNGVTATYDVTDNQRYGFAIGQVTQEKIVSTYGKSGWLGIDFLAIDPDDAISSNTTTLSAELIPNSNYFFTVDPGDISAAEKDYRYGTVVTENTDLSVSAKLTKKWTTSTWYGKKTYYQEWTQLKGTNTIHKHDVDASRDIAIEFIHNDAANITIDAGDSDLIIGGIIRNDTGSTTLRTTGKLTTLSASADSGPTIGGKTINLSATGGVGTDTTAVLTELANNVAGIRLDVTSAGNVTVREASGDMVIGAITGGGLVKLQASGAIQGFNSSNRVTGGSITMTSTSGAVGSAGTAINIDTGALSSSLLNVTATGGVYVNEVAGDLRVNSISAGGDVYVGVVNGDLLDGNRTESRDERAIAELQGAWNAASLTGDLAADKVAAAKEELVQSKTDQYATYWAWRSVQDDYTVLIPGSANYDANALITLNVSEQDYLEQQLESEIRDAEPTLTDAQVADKVAAGMLALRASRTEQFRELHTSYGSLTADYNSAFRVELSDDEKARIDGSIKIWTEDELINAVGAGLLAPVTDTQTTIEADNITGASVTLNVQNGTVGRTGGQVLITLGSAELTSDQRVTLGSAERDDMYFLTTERVGAVVNFAGSSMIRTNGTWDSTFRAGQTIQIEGTTANATEDGNLYTIASVSADRTTIVFTEALAQSESVQSVFVSGVSLDPRGINAVTTISVTDGGTAISAAAGTFDGFNIGDKILIQDQIAVTAAEEASFIGSNNVGSSDSLLVVSAISADGSKMTFGQVQVDGTTLVDISTRLLTAEDAAGANVIVDQWVDLYAVQVQEREDFDISASGVLKVTAGGETFVGSENDLNLDVITVDGDLRVKTNGSILNSVGTAGTANVTGQDIVLESGSGSIGVNSDAGRIYVNTTTDGSLTVRASNDIAITEISGNLNLGTIYSRSGDFDLVVDGSVIDDINSDFANIQAKNISIEAGGSIGSTDNALEFYATGDGLVTLHAAGGNIVVAETESTLNLRNAYAAGDIEIRAVGSIADQFDLVDPSNPDSAHAAGLAGVDVSAGGSILLESTQGFIGLAGNDIEIDSNRGNASGTGTVTTKSGQNQYIRETVGDINVATLETDLGQTAFIVATSGAILNAAAANVSNVKGGRAYLSATGNIGSASKALYTKIGTLQGLSVNGGVWLTNDGALSVDVIQSGYALNTQGNAVITTQSPVTISADISVGGNATFLATETATANDDTFTLKAGIHIDVAGSVLIQAGDDVVTESGSLITGADIVIEADYADADAFGGDVTMAGQVIAETGSITITTNAADDTVSMAAIGTLDDSEAVVTVAGGVATTTTAATVSDTSQLYSLWAKTNIIINTNTGSDTVNIAGRVRAEGDLSIDLGLGDSATDAATFGGTLEAGNALSVTDTGAGRTTFGVTGNMTAATISLLTSDGDDLVVMNGTVTASGIIFIDTNAGSDTVTTGGAMTSTGSSITIDLGSADSGTESITLGGTTTAATSLEILDLGAGQTTLNAGGALIAGSLLAIGTSDGADDIDFAGSLQAAGQVVLDTNAGSDNVASVDGATITSTTANVLIDLGAGDSGAEVISLGGAITAATDLTITDTGGGSTNMTVGGSMTSGGTLSVLTSEGADVLLFEGALQAAAALVINTARGGDRLTTVSGATVTSTGSSVLLQLGAADSGAEVVTLGGTVQAATSLTISDTGAGTTTLTAEGALIAGTVLDVDTSDGDDVIRFEGSLQAQDEVTLHTARGSDSVTSVSGTVTSVASSVMIDLGQGDSAAETLTVLGQINAATTVQVNDDGAGDTSSYTITGGISSGSLIEFILGDGDDTVLLDGAMTASERFELDAGAGSDAVTVEATGALRATNTGTVAAIVNIDFGADDAGAETLTV